MATPEKFKATSLGVATHSLENTGLVKADEKETLFIKLERVMMSTNQVDTYTLRFLFSIWALLLENI